MRKSAAAASALAPASATAAATAMDRTGFTRFLRDQMWHAGRSNASVGRSPERRGDPTSANPHACLPPAMTAGGAEIFRLVLLARAGVQCESGDAAQTLAAGV